MRGELESEDKTLKLIKGDPKFQTIFSPHHVDMFDG